MNDRAVFFALFGSAVVSLAVWVEYGASFGFMAWGGMLFLYGLTCQIR